MYDIVKIMPDEAGMKPWGSMDWTYKGWDYPKIMKELRKEVS